MSLHQKEKRPIIKRIPQFSFGSIPAIRIQLRQAVGVEDDTVTKIGYKHNSTLVGVQNQWDLADMEVFLKDHLKKKDDTKRNYKPPMLYIKGPLPLCAHKNKLRKVFTFLNYSDSSSCKFFSCFPSFIIAIPHRTFSIL